MRHVRCRNLTVVIKLWWGFFYAYRLYFCNHTLHVYPLVCLYHLAVLVKSSIHVSQVRVFSTSVNMAFEFINNTNSAAPKLECGKLYHSKPYIFICGMKWRALPSCYTEGVSLSPIGPSSNLYILFPISFHIPTRTFIAVFVSHATVCFTTCTSSGYKGRSGDRVPVGTTFSATVQTGLEAHPVSYKKGTG
jgi:hypothetical protein